jgi:hypothetical protein
VSAENYGTVLYDRYCATVTTGTVVVLLLAGASDKPANEMTGIQKPPQRLLTIHLLYIYIYILIVFVR